MKYFIVAIVALVQTTIARPQAPQPQAAAAAAQPHPQAAQVQANPGGPTTPVTIVSQTEVIGPDGSFNYSYDTSNGIHFEQGGYVKKNAGASAKSVDPNNPEDTGDVQVLQGAFSYTAPDGQQISLRYVADDNGFQPEGEHLPKAPEVPEAIARSLELQPQAQGQQPQVQQPQAQASLQHPQVLQQAANDNSTPSPVTVA